jgi:ankyrin repeat protein
VDNDGSTALHVSALSCCYATMQYLLKEAGANMDNVNSNGESA